MGIYIIVIGLAIFTAYMAQSYKKRGRKDYKLFYGISFLILFLFSALRYKVGFDYEYTYLTTYKAITYGIVGRFEFLFELLNKFVYRVFDNSDWVFIISSAITMFLIYKVIDENTEYLGLGVLLLFCTRFYLYSFSQVRQYIAIAIFIFSIKYIINKDFKKYLISILIAFGFHKSSIIYIPLYWVNKLKLKKKTYVWFMVIAVFLKPIIIEIYKIIAGYFYSGYLSSGYGVGNTSIVLTATGIILSFLPVIFYSKLENDDKTVVLLNLQLIFWILLCTCQNINESYRILGMFMYPSIILIPECYKQAKSKEKILIFLIILGVSIYGSYLMLDYPGTTMIPYRTIFSK